MNALQPARAGGRPTAVRSTLPLVTAALFAVSAAAAACAGPTAASPTPTAPVPTAGTDVSAAPSAPPTPAVPATAPAGAVGTVDALLTVVAQTNDEQVRPEWPLDGVGVTIDAEGTRCRSLTAEELGLLGDDDSFALGAGFVGVELVEPDGAGCTEGVTVVGVGLGGVMLTAADVGEEEGWDADAADALAAEDAIAAALEADDDPRAAEGSHGEASGPAGGQAAPDGGGSRLGDVVERLATTGYARQYAGVVQDGRRLLAVNAFCFVGEPSWVREYALFMDGGACFWQAAVDPANGEVVTLSINGEA